MVAMRKMNKIWTSSIARLKKVRIYQAYVQSIMLFWLQHLVNEQRNGKIYRQFQQKSGETRMWSLLA